MIHKKYPQVKLIENKENCLFSIANNQGAKIARGEYILLLNSDTLVYSDNLQRMVDFFDKCPEDIICIGPKVLNSDGTIQSTGQPDFGSIIQYGLKIFHINRLLPLNLFFPTLDKNPNRTHRAGWVVGACMMLNRSKYLEVGGLNENLVFYGEEPEFGYRTKKLGYKTLYFAGAEIIHLGGMSTMKKKIEPGEQPFEIRVKNYLALVRETIGYEKAGKIASLTIFSYRIKRLFSNNKEYFDKLIEGEIEGRKYFRSHTKHIK